jgi:hypothetical protein
MQVNNDNRSQIGFGIKINLDKDAATIIAGLPGNRPEKIAKLFRRIEGLGKQQEVVMVKQKSFLGLLGTKIVPATIVKEPTLSIESTLGATRTKDYLKKVIDCQFIPIINNNKGYPNAVGTTAEYNVGDFKNSLNNENPVKFFVKLIRKSINQSALNTKIQTEKFAKNLREKEQKEITHKLNQQTELKRRLISEAKKEAIKNKANNLFGKQLQS